MNDVTRILNDRQPDVAERLLPLLYDDLKKLAAARMQGEPGQTIGPTGLVHEAWLRLAGGEGTWESRGHFFAAAAEAMRRILIDRARRRSAQKRGKNPNRVPLSADQIAAPANDDRLLALDEALQRFAAADPEKAELVKLRYFAGCRIHEAAEILGVSTATADRYWAYARAWLQNELQTSVD
ncbi:MAG: ECF-type sigma factor [Planctomycetaceae bacterium]|nr:ECF-type sigma factor [Planctomycetaceae bacterium]